MAPPAKPNTPSVGLSDDEATNADEDYLYFLSHVELDGDAYKVVIPSKDGGSSPPEIIRYEQPLPGHNVGAPIAGSDCGGQRAPPPLEENSRAMSEATPRGVKRKVPNASPNDVVRSSVLGEDGGEEEEDDLPMPGQSGKDVVGMKEAIPASETKDGVDSDLPILKVMEEEDDVRPRSDVQSVNDPVSCETKKKPKEGENTMNAQVEGTTELDPLEKEASSSKGHLAMPLNASELQGVIWPPHINERPNSVFKEKLIEFLMKPFIQEEYDRYFSLASKRTPILKERRTCNNVVEYNWTHDMSKSYFDRYPDLAKQFSLQRNNSPNGLALLRGLFFWLQNITQEGKFKPWSYEFKKYRVAILIE